MKKSLSLIERGFESSSGLTPEFAEFFKTFRRELRAEIEKEHGKLKAFEAHRGHFYASGFFELQDGRIFYFSYGDARWGKKHEMLLRTAKDFKDFSGGANNFVDISREGFMRNLPR